MSWRLYFAGLLLILGVQASDSIIDWRPWWTFPVFLVLIMGWAGVFMLTHPVRTKTITIPANTFATGLSYQPPPGSQPSPQQFGGLGAPLGRLGPPFRISPVLSPVGPPRLPLPHEIWGPTPPVPTDEPRAIVGVTGYRLINSTLSDAPAVCGHGRSHKAPAWDCSCGYYALVQEHPDVSDAPLGLFIKVEAVGRVIIHGQGWRAERIRRVE